MAYDKVFDIILFAVGAILLALVLYPLYFVLIASISDPIAVSGGKVWLLPYDISISGYKKVFENARVWTGYKNTILYTVVGTFINLAVTIPAGYALSRRDLKFRNALMLFFTFTMFFSGGLIPSYINIKNLNMLNTFWVMVIPGCLSVYNLIITRTFFQSNLPLELLEAAQLDGCSNTRFFLNIAIPLSKAVIAVIGLYYAVGHWNAFFNALIYLKGDTYVPLQLVLRDILLQNQFFSQGTTITSGFDEAQKLGDMVKYSIIVVSTVPILCVYPFIQKYFTKGVMIGAIKG